MATPSLSPIIWVRLTAILPGAFDWIAGPDHEWSRLSLISSSEDELSILAQGPTLPMISHPVTVTCDRDPKSMASSQSCNWVFTMTMRPLASTPHDP